MTAVILTLHYPKTGIVQSQEYPTLHLATSVAHGHYAAFPGGYAQITDKDSAQVLMANEELRGTFDMARRRDEAPAAPQPVEQPEESGFFSRWFGQRASDSAAG
jgi:hypothetical protein